MYGIHDQVAGDVRRASGGLAGPARSGPRAAGNRSRSRPTITGR